VWRRRHVSTPGDMLVLKHLHVYGRVAQWRPSKRSWTTNAVPGDGGSVSEEARPCVEDSIGSGLGLPVTRRGVFYAWVNIEETGHPAGKCRGSFLAERESRGIGARLLRRRGEKLVRFSLVSGPLLEDALETDKAGIVRWRAAERGTKPNFGWIGFRTESSDSWRRGMMKMQVAYRLGLCLEQAWVVRVGSKTYPRDVQTHERRLKEIRQDSVPTTTRTPEMRTTANGALASPRDERATLACENEIRNLWRVRRRSRLPYDDFKPEPAKWLAREKDGRPEKTGGGG